MEEINPYHVKDREHRGRDTILIVDDIEVNRIILQSIFERIIICWRRKTGNRQWCFLSSTTETLLPCFWTL